MIRYIDWKYVQLKVFKWAKILITLAFFIGLAWWIMGCGTFPGATEVEPAVVEPEAKPKIRQYRPESETKSAREQIDELTQEYSREPDMHVYSFPMIFEGQIRQYEIRVYYWEISKTHYVELVTFNGEVISKNTKEKFREGK